MRRHRLLRTSAIRLALRYLLAYALVLVLALAAVLVWTSLRHDEALEVALAAELSSLAAEYAHGGSTAVAAAVDSRDPADARLYLLVAGDGRRLAGDWQHWPDDVEADDEVRSVWLEEESLPPGRFDDDAYLPLAAKRLPDGSRLLVAAVVPQPGMLYELAESLIESLPLALLLALALGSHMGYAILRRIEAIERTAGDIMAGNLSRRVPLAGRDDEIDALAARLNAMLDRIQQLMRGLREVTDNIAHDLRSPLARLRNRLEVTLLERRGEEEYRAAIAQTVEDADTLIRTFNALLGIAQIEAGNHRSDWGVVDLAALADDLAELYAPAAEEKGQTLLRENGRGVHVAGSRALLAQALGNLLDNAVKYTPRDGTIHLRVGTRDGRPFVSVADTGSGIPPAERAHVLERFVRLEGSRHTPGNGLGLSLVKAVAALHRADLDLDEARPGLIVTLRFPL